MMGSMGAMTPLLVCTVVPVACYVAYKIICDSFLGGVSLYARWRQRRSRSLYPQGERREPADAWSVLRQSRQK